MYVYVIKKLRYKHYHAHTLKSDLSPIFPLSIKQVYYSCDWLSLKHYNGYPYFILHAFLYLLAHMWENIKTESFWQSHCLNLFIHANNSHNMSDIPVLCLKNIYSVTLKKDCFYVRKFVWLFKIQFFHFLHLIFVQLNIWSMMITCSFFLLNSKGTLFKFICHSYYARRILWL